MKKLFMVIFSAGFCMVAAAQNVGINNPSPDSSSILDIKSNNKGILIPRVALTSTNDNSTVPSPALSLMLYNTVYAGSGTSAVEPGYYYWNGYWVKMMSVSNSAVWKMGGNASTFPGQDFIGTTDARSLFFKVNNKISGAIDIDHGSTLWGYASGESITGNFNTGLGYMSLNLTSGGVGNTAVGAQSLVKTTLGSYNTGVGYSVLNSMAAQASFNTAVGTFAGYYLGSGDRNTSIGYLSMLNVNTGTAITAIGDHASPMSSGFINATALGANSTVACNNCLVLGSVNNMNGGTSDVNVGIGTATPSQPLSFRSSLGGKISLFESGTTQYGIGIANSLMQFYVGYDAADFAFGSGTSTAFNETVRIRASGRMGILTNNPEAALDVRRGSNAITAQFYGSAYITHFNYGADEHTYIRGGKAGAHIYLNDINGAGNVGVGNITPQYKLDVKGVLRCVGFLNESDARLKTNIVPVSSTLDDLLKLNAYHYNWIDTSIDQSLQTGLIAQEVQAVYPDLVKTDAEGVLSVNYQGLVPLLIEGMKTLRKEIDEMKKNLAK